MRALAQKIGDLLLEKGASLSCAESCTGGLLAHLFTSVPGASGWFHTGVVAYTEESKQRILRLSQEEVSEGLITKRCGEAMAKRISELTGTDYALSTTGVCGPDSSEGYAPCTAWIALATPRGITSTLFTSSDLGRQHNKEQVAEAALALLICHLEL